MYIRFETDLMLTETSYKKGIFTALGNLKRMEVMTPKEYDWYRDTAVWFNDNLESPQCFIEPLSNEVRYIAKSWLDKHLELM